MSEKIVLWMKDNKEFVRKCVWFTCGWITGWLILGLSFFEPYIPLILHRVVWVILAISVIICWILIRMIDQKNRGRMKMCKKIKVHSGLREDTDPKKEYLKRHPDLCPYLIILPECETYTDPKCHSLSHVDCPIYLQKERK